MSGLVDILQNLGLSPREAGVLARLADIRVVSGWSREEASRWGISERSLERVCAGLALGGWCVGKGGDGLILKSAECFVPSLGGFGAVDREWLVVVGMDLGRRVVGSEVLATGGAGAVVFDYPSVFRAWLKWDARRGFVVHNHPCGVSTPSQADRLIARDLAKSAKTLEIDCWGFYVWADSRLTRVEPAD